MNKFFFFLAFSAFFTFTACVDNDFDEPEDQLMIDPSDVITIDEVLSLLQGGAVLLDENVLPGDPTYISGTVTADDESGNFFKVVVFEDATGALSVSADQNELNSSYPTGSRVYVKLNGLTLAFDSGTPRLGLNLDGNRLLRIPDALVAEYLIPGGQADFEVVPTVTTLDEIESNLLTYLNKLVTLEEVEFAEEFLGQTYAINDGINIESVNMTLQECSGDEIVMRNSGFADFSRKIIPGGSGKVTGIISDFSGTRQLTIRDEEDVDFGETRCDGSTTGGGGDEEQITIQSLQDLYYGQGADSAPKGYIQGIVISDRTTGQVNSQNIILQNGEDGVIIRFTADHSFNLGDEVRVVVTGRELSEFRAQFQVNNVPVVNATRLSTATLPEGKEMTVAQILADNNTVESTRVLIKGATLSGSATFAGNVFVDDGTGSVTIFTFNTTSYANEPVPTGTVDVTGIVSEYENNDGDRTVQLIINGPNDIEGGSTGGGGGDDDLSFDFEAGADFEPFTGTGWLNVATVGTRVWIKRSFDNNGFLEVRGFDEDSPIIESYLVTPTIDLDEVSMMSFESAIAFFAHNGLEVLISPDFTDLGDANWSPITDFTLAGSSQANYDWVPSGTVDLKAYGSGKVRVGFKYTGDNSSNTTTFRLDNLEIK